MSAGGKEVDGNASTGDSGVDGSKAPEAPKPIDVAPPQ